MFDNTYAVKKESFSGENALTGQASAPRKKKLEVLDTEPEPQSFKSETLNSVAQLYSMSTAPNTDTAQNGELAAVITAALSVYMRNKKQANTTSLRVLPYHTSTAWSMASRWENTGTLSG